MNNMEKPKSIEKTDLEIVLTLIQHIEEPCEVQVGDNKHNIRAFYIREGKALLPQISNPDARAMLKATIEKHDK
ncbi:hypothetical protein A3A01_02005 [Candidatus Nomurabacteria bacterium RIFCSPLOWO2_01_FULL_39_17]|uniref:Uncharacterized protein n=1 Tax=Candidatus Nomurabacteria bacterium RIFCSPLOWO2_01_FULL_39_17 TaxID=1801770 RepID=A0A1F6WUP5_9BACT|nr:MAG: hypothetical protein A3A01_02005 [Candidatus Nomurabacteria bacterium RIFCSPLOWO2_01_FULL_39_17]